MVHRLVQLWPVLSKARDMDLEFDQDANVRATDDGMPSLEDVEGSTEGLDG